MTTASLPFRFFRNAFSAFMSAREKQAEAYVTGALLMLDDETLRRSGFNRSELRQRPSRYPMF